MTAEILVFSLIIPLVVAFILPALKPKAATWLSAISFLIPMFVTLGFLLTTKETIEVPIMSLPAPVGEFYLLADPISNAFGFTICLVSAMVAFYSLPYMKHRFEEMLHDGEIRSIEWEFRKYWFLYNLYAVAMLWLVYAGNFILLYIFLEISLLASFLLIYMYGYGNRQWVAVLYFVWTHIAGVLALLGILIIGFENSTMAFNAVKAVGFTAWLLIFLGMLVKLPGLGPHIWLPWAHAEAPTPVSALLSPLTVGLAGYVLLRVYMIDSSFIDQYRDIIIAYAIVSSIYAGFSVFKQKDYKRLLAYSTVSQMGYVLIALCLGSYGLLGVVIQYISHAFGKSILFMTAGAIIASFHGLRDINRMSGMHEYVPTIANAALLGFMTLSGILTIGMFGEFYILAGLTTIYGFNLAVILAVVVVFIISGLYSFYTMKVIYYGTPAGYEKPKVSRLLDVPLYVVAFFSVAFIFPPLSTALLSGLKVVLGIGGVMPMSEMVELPMMGELLALLFFTPIIASFPIAIAWGMDPRPEWARKLPVLSVLGLFVSLCVALYILFNVGELSPEAEPIKYTIYWLPDFNINFVFIFDYLSKLMGALTAVIAFLIGVYGLEYMRDDYRLGWYWFFFNLFTASMLLVVYSDNLLMLLIGWEGLGIASWGLIGHWFRDDDELSYVGILKRKVAGLNMFWSPSTGAWRAISTIRVGDMPMFFAIGALFALTGTLNITEIPWAGLEEKIGVAGVVILLVAFLMGPFTKSAQLPFSEWLMTAMTGPTTVSALLHSATMVAAGTYLFMRLSWYIQPWELHLEGYEYVYVLVLFLGLVSSLYAALVATSSLERKVLLAASTMSSLGLMFASAAASYWVGKFALLVAFWYLITHAFAKATLFLVAGHLIHETHDRFLGGDTEVARKLKWAFVATVVATIFLSGIPPFTAYWVKSGMDGVMHHLEHEFGIIPLALLVTISAIYSGFLGKFLSMNFFKGKKVHLHLHGGQIMSTAYLIMVSMLLVILAAILTSPEEPFKEFVEEGLLPSSFAVGMIVLVAYAFGFFKPQIKSPLGQFFGDRMYMMFLNDYIVPKIGWAIAKVVDYGNMLIDFTCHQAIPGMFEVYSQGIRFIQNGRLERYLQIVIGFVMLIVVVAVAAGWIA